MPAQLTMRLWTDPGGFAPIEFAHATMPSPAGGSNTVTFNFGSLTAPLAAITVHDGTADLPSALLRTGLLSQLPAGESASKLSVLFGQPATLPLSQLQSLAAGVVSGQVLQFQQPELSIGPLSVTFFGEVNTVQVTGLNPAAQTVSMMAGGQARVGEFGPEVAFTASFDVTFTGSSDPVSTADIASVAVVPGSVHASFSSGSLLGSAEAAAANALSGAIAGKMAPEITQKLTASVNAALPSVVTQALRTEFATLPALPSGVVIAISSTQVLAGSLSVTASVGQAGDVLATLLLACPPPQVLAVCQPPLLRQQDSAPRRFTVHASYQGTPVGGKVYYPTQADLIGAVNTVLDVVINGQTTVVRDADPKNPHVTTVTTYPEAYVVPDPATGHAMVRCPLFEA